MYLHFSFDFHNFLMSEATIIVIKYLLLNTMSIKCRYSGLTISIMSNVQIPLIIKNCLHDLATTSYLYNYWSRYIAQY